MKYADFTQVTRSRTNIGLIDDRATIAGTAVGLVRSVFPLSKKIQLLGVTVSNFDDFADAMQGRFDFGEI